MNLSNTIRLAGLVLSLSLISPAARAETLSFAIIGDAGEWTEEAESVRDSILRTEVRSLVIPGDNLYRTREGYDSAWLPWSSKGFTYDVVAVGNHNAGMKKEVRYFGMPKDYYSKVYPGVARFIVLNSNAWLNVGKQMKFFERQLESATEPLVFLVYHHPTYTLANHGHFWQERFLFQLAIRPLLWKHRSKLTALIVGHDHLATLLHYDDLPVILSGAVKEVRKDGPVHYQRGRVHVKTDWYFDSTPHWVRLDLDAATGKARAHFIRSSDDQVGCSFGLQTGIPASLDTNCTRTHGDP